MTVAEGSASRPSAGRVPGQSAARVVGWTTFAVGMGLRVLALWFTAQMGPGTIRFNLGIGPASFVASDILGTATGLVGAIIVARRPSNVVAWLYVVTGVIQSILTSGFAHYAITAVANPATPSLVFAWLSGVVDYSVPFSFAAFVLTLFPNGRVTRPAWRWVVALAAAGQALRVLEVGLGASTMPLVVGAANPYQVGGVTGDLLRLSSSSGLGSLLVEGAFVLSAFALVDRYRASSFDGRRQIRWILLAGFIAVLGAVPLAISELLPGALPTDFDVISVLFLALALTPVATLIAINRYRLYEIDRIVNRALVYGSLTAILAGVFTAGVSLAQRLFVAITGVSSDAAIVLTTLIVATLYAPLRKRLESVVDRRFKFDQVRFGAYRAELIEVLSLIDPHLAAERLIREAVTELEATGGAVLGRSGAVTARAGSWPVEAAEMIEIPGGSRAIASLALGGRADGAAYRRDDIAELQRVAELTARAAADARASR